MSKAYSKKLRDPRWQKKRLKILERDNWACLNCGSTEKTLHVHHLEYNGDPWEAKDDKLETLCEECHKLTHEWTDEDLKELTKRVDGACKSITSIIYKAVDDISECPDFFEREVLIYSLRTGITTFLKKHNE